MNGICIRKMTAAFLAMVTITSLFTISVSAETPQTLDEYVDEVLPTYLNAHNFSEEQNYYTSNIINVTDYETGDVYTNYMFVFVDNSIVGKMQIDLSQTGYHSSFDTDIPNEIQQIYQNGESFALTFDDNYIFLVSGEINTTFGGVESNATFNGNIAENTVIVRESNFEYIQPEVISLNIAKGGVMTRGTAFADYNLNVSHVSNEYIIEIGRHVCWAACIAMKLNYQYGYNLSARDVFEASKWLDSDLDDPGYEYTHSNAYSEYGYNNYTYVDGSISSQDIALSLRNNIPVELGIEGTNTDGDAAAHALIVKGVQLYTDKATFVFLDPSAGTASTSITISGGTHNLPISSFNYSKNYNDGHGTYNFTSIYYAYY